MRRMFARPKPEPSAADLYAAVVAEARRPHWYAKAGVPDTMDGRFALLATLLALTDLRLERGGEAARKLAPRLAECFIADMDAQMREAGFGDPSLGKQVRMMVGSLASRVERWRGAVEAPKEWEAAALASLYRDSPQQQGLSVGGSEAIRAWWARLLAADDVAIGEGRIG